ncbi:penicillin-binding protein 2 [Sediminitomix flava]|uniref:Penicillin-binding protein 2 n=1 Tax=Sediminitomix flava TaxID=379075 RepID=A0A315ZHI4_SEDFL|nr:penicillin-binding protein 2 [Sediminitomix flava]PWJ44659.1 penicillin-binding protein 2 [Sediminitomix flava]
MNSRSIQIIIAFGIIVLIFSIRLLNIQVFEAGWKTKAETNMVAKKVVHPPRGLIFDRNGQILVNNTPVFDLMVVRNQLEIDDTLAFRKLLNIESNEELRKMLKSASPYYRPTVFIPHLNKDEYALMADKLLRYKGLYGVPRTIREYPHTNLANVLGYVKEVDRAFLDKDTTGYYHSGDMIGKNGLEKYYEEYLRGQRGVKHVITNVKGLEKGKYMDGALDTLPVVGQNLTSTIDLDLQKYGELLMQNKKGAVVAIEPATGEVLTMISAPTYDPNLLTGKGKKVSRNYVKLLRDTNKPLFDRSMQSMYPPGSTFKTIMAMMGLQEGVIDTVYTRLPCSGERVGCHHHPSPLTVGGSIIHSCNPWYYKAMRKIVLQDEKEGWKEDLHFGLDKWKSYVNEFGLGTRLGIDLPYEKAGLVPGPDFYTRAYKHDLWKISNVYSISIGQGEILSAPLQLANLGAIIANRGYYYTPHLIKGIGEENEVLDRFKEKKKVSVQSDYIDYIARAMSKVPEIGTARLAYMSDIKVAGKTGTAQNPHGEDHSIFMAFAPADNPKIAIAVYVENAGFGGTWAAPIARLMIEKYIKGEITNSWLEQYVLKGNFIKEEEDKEAEKAR